jgi:O-antigen ligase
VPLTPLGLIAFTAAFVVAVALTLRRPRYALATMIACLPIAFYASVGDTMVTLPKVLLLGACTGLLPRLRSLPDMRAARPLLLAFGGVVAAIALSLIPSEHRIETLREAAKWIEYGLFFAVVYVLYRIDRDDKLLRYAWLLSIVLVCVTALAQQIVPPPIMIVLRGAPAPRVSGLLEGPNQLAAYLEIALAIVAAWNLYAPEKAARWVLALAACTLILTFSRAGIACAFLALAIVAIIERRRIVELVPAAAGALCGAAGALMWWFFAPMLWHGRLITWPYAGGVGYRSELWRAALYFFRNHPVLGIGAGNFELELPAAGVSGVRTHANNWYLQALAEGGIVLLAATIAWIVTLFRSLTRDLPRSPWRIAAFAASIALVAHQSVDYLVFYPKVAEPWIALIALGIAAPANSEDPGGEAVI